MRRTDGIVIDKASSAPATLLAVLLVVACESESDTSTDQQAATPCEAAWQVQCTRACDCQPGPECSFAPGAWQDDGGAHMVPGAVVQSEDACRQTLQRINCGSDGSGVVGADYAACEAALQTAACESFEAEGTTYTGVVPTPACDFL